MLTAESCFMLLLLRHSVLTLAAGLVSASFISAAAAAPQQNAAQPSAQAQEKDSRVGQKVIVTEAGAPLQTPKETVWKAYLGETFTVALTNGEWLWVAEKGGWLSEKQVVLFDNAIEELTKRIQQQPSPENYHLRGIAYSVHEEYDKAVTDFEMSLKKKPGTAGVLNNLGQVHYLQNDFDAAIKDFTAAITSAPDHFIALNNRALCLIAKEDFDGALRDLNAALKLNQKYPEALNNRGVVFSKKGDYPAAIKDYSAALEIDDKYIDAYGNRSFAYRQLKKFTEAISDLQMAMHKNPLDYKPVNDLAWVLATAAESSVRDPKRALELATKACQMTQYKNWNSLDTLAAAHAANGDFKSAQQWVATAIEAAPDDEKDGLNEHLELIQAEKPIVK